MDHKTTRIFDYSTCNRRDKEEGEGLRENRGGGYEREGGESKSGRAYWSYLRLCPTSINTCIPSICAIGSRILVVYTYTADAPRVRLG